MKTHFLSLAVASASLVVAAFASGACSSSDSTGSSSGSTSGAVDSGASSSGASSGSSGNTTAATFTTVYTTIIATKCAPCHTTAAGDGVTDGMLDMTSQSNAFTNLVNVAAAGTSCATSGTAGLKRVVPSDSAASLLYQKVDPDVGAPCGSKMPLGSVDGLDEASADMIKSWIDDGAKNN